MEIDVLHKQGLNIHAIACQLGISKNTVKRYLRQPSKLPIYPPRAKRYRKLDPYRAHIHKRIGLCTKP